MHESDAAFYVNALARRREELKNWCNIMREHPYNSDDRDMREKMRRVRLCKEYKKKARVFFNERGLM